MGGANSTPPREHFGAFAVEIAGGSCGGAPFHLDEHVVPSAAEDSGVDAGVWRAAAQHVNSSGLESMRVNAIRKHVCLGSLLIPVGAFPTIMKEFAPNALSFAASFTIAILLGVSVFVCYVLSHRRHERQLRDRGRAVAEELTQRWFGPLGLTVTFLSWVVRLDHESTETKYAFYFVTTSSAPTAAAAAALSAPLEDDDGRTSFAPATDSSIALSSVHT